MVSARIVFVFLSLLVVPFSRSIPLPTIVLCLALQPRICLHLGPITRVDFRFSERFSIGVCGTLSIRCVPWHPLVQAFDVFFSR